MFLCSLVEELCTKEENDKTGCNFNFGHECIFTGYTKCYIYSLGLKIFKSSFKFLNKCVFGKWSVVAPYFF